ncbi:MAG: TMEM175 family protein [Candidatus Dormibacteraeota bacterium]|nr:TMEM175 family protein [Candidatus Dormibacteraeota bacterium]
MNKTRAEAFSDGVFAVAATVLVFAIAAPDVGAGLLSNALLEEWPSYAAFAISFLTIVVIWVNHHVVFDSMDRVDRPLLFLNALLLLTVAVIPFPTGVLAHYLQAGHDQQAAAFAYGLAMSAMAIAFSCFTLYARRFRRSYVPLDWIGFSFGLALYPLATLLTLADFRLSLVIYASITVFYLVLPIIRERLTHSSD